jgi:uncharacterized Zn-finger protein
MSKDTHLNTQAHQANRAHMNKLRHIKMTDCPLSCPMPTDTLWNAHPRVYLAIEETGRVTCPYCETQYVLDVDSENARRSE